MKALQKYLVGFLAFSFALIMVGCQAAETATETEDEKDDGKIKIGMSFPAADHGFLGAIIKYAEDQAKELDVEYVVATAQNPNKQSNDIDDFIAQKVDAIVILPIESAALTPTGKRIKDAGIPFVVVDRELESDDATAVVIGDNEGIGIGSAEFLAEQLGGKGKIVEITGVPSSVTTLRSQGFRDVLSDYPDIEIIASQSGDFQTEKSLTVMQNILQSQKEIDAVYVQDDEMAFGVMQAIKEANRNDIKMVTGAGGHKDAYKQIQEDNTLLKATFFYSPLMVKEGVKIAVDLANGKTTPQKINKLEATKITKENVDEFYDEDAFY
ncbi:substrate-binding domain-containing protein [Bacillaceae bacterium Marseille-Q3522]|nr:substrate-binding domain-containing protein [Bacillaceae bacterium Marseille-Q3522]